MTSRIWSIAIIVVVSLTIVGLGVWLYPRPPSGPISVEGEVLYFTGVTPDRRDIGPVKIDLEKEDAELFWEIVENGTPAPGRPDCFFAWFQLDFQYGRSVSMIIGTSGLVRYDYRTVLTRYGFDEQPKHIVYVNMAVIKKLMQPFYDEYVKQNGITEKGYWPTDQPPAPGK